MKKRNDPATTIGSALLLVVFIVLSLVIFATMSLTTANNDYVLSRKIADRNTAYYEASNRAEELLQLIDGAMLYARTVNPKDYVTTALNDIAYLTEIVIEIPPGGDRMPTFSFTVPIGDTSVLKVTVEIQPLDMAKDSYFKVLRWQEESIRQWNPDQSLNLLGG